MTLPQHHWAGHSALCRPGRQGKTSSRCSPGLMHSIAHQISKQYPQDLSSSPFSHRHRHRPHHRHRHDANIMVVGVPHRPTRGMSLCLLTAEDIQHCF